LPTKSKGSLLLALTLLLDAISPPITPAAILCPGNAAGPCPDQHDRPPCTDLCSCPPGGGGPFSGPGAATPTSTGYAGCGPNQSYRSVGIGNAARFGSAAAMPVWWVSEPRLNLRLEDEPLGYNPAVG